MNNRCDVPLFSIDAAIGMVAVSAWTTRTSGPGVAVDFF
jgi:hypothetical protein